MSHLSKIISFLSFMFVVCSPIVQGSQPPDFSLEGDGIWGMKNNHTLWCNSTTSNQSSDSSSSSLDMNSVLIGGAVTVAFTFAYEKILAPVLDRLSYYHSCTQWVSKKWYACKSYSPCCRGVCSSASSETMELDQVIPRPKKGWCCLRQTHPTDFEGSLHLLDKSLGNSGWEKNPIVADNTDFPLIGFRYDNGNSWIAIVREYDDANIEPYKLHKELRDTCILQRELESIRRLIKGRPGAEKKHFELDREGIQIIPSSVGGLLSNRRREAKKASDAFIMGLFPAPSDSNAERPRIIRLKELLQKILGSWKYDGVFVELSEDKQNAYLVTTSPFTRCGQLAIYIHKGSSTEVSDGEAAESSATSSSSSIHATAVTAGKSGKRVSVEKK